MNEDVDEFEILEHQKLFVRPVTEQEQDYTYTQERRILEDSGCVGHFRVDMDTTGNSFFTDWTDHVHELNDSQFKNEFDHIINELRNNPKYENILNTTGRTGREPGCFYRCSRALSPENIIIAKNK